jgi:hypothetical protein
MLFLIQKGQFDERLMNREFVEKKFFIENLARNEVKNISNFKTESLAYHK